MAMANYSRFVGIDNEQLWKRYQHNKDDLAIRNELAERYLPMCRHIANRLYNSLRFNGNCTKDDLESAGYLGLIKAVERFDPALGYAFSTYARRKILSRMIQEMRTVGHSRRKAKRWESEPAKVFHFIEAETDVDDNMKETTLIRNTINAVEDECTPSPDDSMITEDSLALILSQLADRERSIVQAIYLEGHTARYTAQLLGVSEGLISRLLNHSILPRLRSALAPRKEELLYA